MPIPPFKTLTVEERLSLARRLAWLMDSSVKIPFLGKTLGVDAILGLLPVGGDFVGFLISLYIVYIAKTLDIPNRLLARMIGNLVLDLTVGSVPLVGDIADSLWKANLRNMAIIDAHLGIPKVRKTPLIWQLAASALKRQKQQPLPPGKMTVDVRPATPRADRA